jgi:hypothetical protein
MKIGMQNCDYCNNKEYDSFYLFPRFEMLNYLGFGLGDRLFIFIAFVLTLIIIYIAGLSSDWIFAVVIIIFFGIEILSEIEVGRCKNCGTSRIITVSKRKPWPSPQLQSLA